MKTQGSMVSRPLIVLRNDAARLLRMMRTWVLMAFVIGVPLLAIDAAYHAVQDADAVVLIVALTLLTACLGVAISRLAGVLEVTVTIGELTIFLARSAHKRTHRHV